MIRMPVPAVVGLIGKNRQVICNYVFSNGRRTLWDYLEVKLCALDLSLAVEATVSLAYCAIIVKMHTSNRFHPVYGCVLILVSVMYFNVEAKCPAGLKNKTCRRDLSRICPACIEVSWLIRPPFTFQNGNYTSGILPGTKVQIFYKHLTLKSVWMRDHVLLPPYDCIEQSVTYPRS